MKRFDLFLDWLSQNDRPPEAQSPLGSSAMAALVSFIFIYWLDGRWVSTLQLWWAQLLAYGFIPMLLAFIILYRSSWHRQIGRCARASLLVLMSGIIFGGVLIATILAMILLALIYYACGDISRFHY